VTGGLPAGNPGYQELVSMNVTRLRLVKGGDAGSSSPEPLDDARLVAAVRSGNSGMAGAFYDRTRPMVARTVQRLLGSHDSDFEDLVQVAMIALLRSLDRYRGDCSLDTWAGTISANVVYKHIRRRGLERTIFCHDLAPEDVPRSAQQAPVARGMVARVAYHLGQISSERAWAFVLHDVHGYSLEEVATMTGTTVAAAQSRLVRGRRELHERIAADPDLASGIDALEDPS
jgi:RNA polymerase sigma-70 factor, ECF subfamily